jgi:ATP-dependent Zn protease
MSQTRERTAHHEAGHAVIGYKLGGYTCAATIRPNAERGTLGHATSGGYSISAHVLSLYAGRAAEAIFAGCEVTEGHQQDYDEAAEFLGELGETQEAMEERARLLVVEHWGAIATVAQALLEHETLRGEELDFLIDCHDEGLDWRERLPWYRQHVSDPRSEGAP